MRLNLPRNLLASTALFIAVATFSARGDDGLRVGPQALLGLQNIWTKTQTVTGGAALTTGAPAGMESFYDGTASRLLSYNPGVAWLPFYLEGSPLILNSQSGGPVRAAGALQVGSTAASTVSAGETALAKITASGTAPGAGFLKFAAVPGTNAGTCRLIAYAGTSTTPVTIVDNVGSGC